MTTPTPTTVQVKIQLRRDTAATWASVNPVLLAGEAGLETDTNKIKIGNGSTAWNSLGYFPFVVNGGTVTGNLEIGTTGTLTFEGSSADNFETTLGVINPTADRTINLPNVSGTIITTGDTGTVTSTMIADGTIVDADIAANAEIAVSKLADGAARQLLQTDAAGTGVEWTSNVDIPGTLDVTGTATFDGAVTVAGDLTVNGTTTTISTQNLLVEDKNIIIGDVATPTDTTADGGGITLKGATDKTINWVDSTDAWTSSEHINIASGKEYRIAGTSVLTGTTLGSGITSSSLTSVGTLGSLTVTGATTAGTFIPTSGAAPSNGLYLPAANSVALSTNSSERLRITSTGLVGVGTSAPQQLLHVHNSSAADARLKISNDTTGSAQYDGLELSCGSTGLAGIIQWEQQPIYFYTNNGSAVDPRLIITAAGAVGIGTASPSASLSVASTTTSYTAESFNIGEPSFSNGRQLYMGYNTADGVGFIQPVHWGTEFKPLVLCPSGGRVGIGTTSPGAKLDVSGTGTTTARVTTVSSGNAGYEFLNSGANSAYIELDRSTGGMAFGIGANEAARFDGSRRLLVGTSSARSNFVAATVNSAFQIEGAGGDYTNQYRSLSLTFNVNNTQGPNIFLAKTRSASNGGVTVVNSGDEVGTIYFCGADGTNLPAAASIGGFVDGAAGANDMPGRLVFSTTADGASSPTERMKITQSGEIYVRCGSGAWNFIANNTSAAGTVSALYSGRYSVTDNTGTTGTQSYVVWTNGNVQNTNNSYTAISDIKLKENVVDANSQWADIKSLQVRNYNLKEGQTHRQIGLIAQEVELISPGLVYESPDRDDDGNDLGTVTKSVNYSVLYMKAVKALQEAMLRIEDLEARLDAANL